MAPPDDETRLEGGGPRDQDPTRLSRNAPPDGDPTRLSRDIPVDHDATQLSAGGFTAPSAGQPAIPRVLGRYTIRRKIGEGGMGVVFEAEQQNPQRKVAVKVLKSGPAISSMHAQMFQREVDTLARLNHPDIAAIYESGSTAEGLQFLAMELIHGETLDKYLASRPRSSDPQEGRLRPARSRGIHARCPPA